MATGKRARDYRAEEARRNAKYRAMGFTSRAQARRALAKGEWTPERKTPGNPRSPIVPPTISGGGGKLPPQAPGSKDTPDVAQMRRESVEWSRKHSRMDTSRFNPRWPSGRVRAYHAAFVNDETRAWKIENGLDSLREYLVGTMGYYTDTEFDERYGVSSHAF